MSYSSVAVDNVNLWYNIVAVYDGTKQVVYVNNVAGAAAANSGNVRMASQNLRISGYTNNTYRLNGTMDDVRLYNRALSPGEVAELYATPEPATIFLLGLGSVLLIRKHKK